MRSGHTLYVLSGNAFLEVKCLSEDRWRPPAWMYREKKPTDDDDYFENMTRVIFQAGLSWKMIGRKWPSFRRAFKDFAIDEVACMPPFSFWFELPTVYA